MADLHLQLRHHKFQEYERSPRMLPRAYNPSRLDVDCSTKTPVKPVKAAAGKRARGGAALGAIRKSLLALKTLSPRALKGGIYN